ncbi:unnamed protein product [Calicophoron daubneyi]|uniref:Coiled-coil domain-containing protein 176 n=1 Tax=Calicophoron daubneyi TaxID=300641 RepID=A0AAV2T3F7_CALDB
MAQVQENLNMLEEKLKHKEEDMLLLRRALSELIEFRDEKDMFNAKMRMMESRVTQGNVERQEIIEKMELKFFDEKLRLRQESIRSIQAIAEDAHRHVLSNLSLSIKKVYKQNMDMRIIIKYLKDQFNCMKQTSENLNQENKQLLLEKEILEATLSEKISEMKFMREKLKQKSLHAMKLENELRRVENTKDDKTALASQQDNAQLVEQMFKALQFEKKQASRVYRLANRVLEQRTEMESFFLTALDQVRGEIYQNQKNYKDDAKAAYETRLRLAYYGAAEYPPIRTFRGGLPSTNSVYDDLKLASKLPQRNDVKFGELTWEQKELVLSIMFAQMNAGKRKEPVPAICDKQDIACPAEKPASSQASDKVIVILQGDCPPEHGAESSDHVSLSSTGTVIKEIKSTQQSESQGSQVEKVDVLTAPEIFTAPSPNEDTQAVGQLLSEHEIQSTSENTEHHSTLENIPAEREADGNTENK